MADQELFPQVSSSVGIFHCGKMRQWMEMSWRVEGEQWMWICPKCKEVVRVDEFVCPPLT